MMKKRVHIVPHTHWDREWYFTSQRSMVYLIDEIKEIIDTLEAKPEFPCFLLDAQSSLIEDYLKFYPEDKVVLKKLISEKRLLIGPWYTQSDLFVVSAESVTRNLYYGSDYAEKMGHSMKIGYVPDSFGQGGNMPQIYRSFGIDALIFWRGIGDDKLDYSEFLWEGSDGTVIPAVQMPFGYFYGANFPRNEENDKAFIDVMIPKLEARSLYDDLYYPCGFDQLPINNNLPEITRRLQKADPEREYLLSSPELYFEAIAADMHKQQTIKGELLESKNSRVHKTIFSSRSDLKMLNNKVENYITNILEPIAYMRYCIDGRYPHKEIETIWKWMFESAAHDSIGCCNSDKTNLDIFTRLGRAWDFAENLAEYLMRMIAQQIKQEGYYGFTVYNPLPYRRSGWVEADVYIPGERFCLIDDLGNQVPYEIRSIEDQSNYVLHQAELLTPNMFREQQPSSEYPAKVYRARLNLCVTDIPALGYGQCYLHQVPEVNLVHVSSERNYIENERFLVTVEENNSFTVTDKISGRCYPDQIVFYENGDDGDSYNYSPPRRDCVISSYQAKRESHQVICTAAAQRMELRFTMAVPQNLEERADGGCSGNLPYTVSVTLVPGEPLVRVQAAFDNQVKSHRVCVRCHSEIDAEYSIADEFYGVITRGFNHPEINTWQQNQWTEAPVAINPMQSFVSLSNDQQTMTMFTKGVREYEITGTGMRDIQLTLFRTYGYMGKENLLYRPGRASGESIEKTPDAELQGTIRCEFAIGYETQSFDNLAIARQAKEYLSPMQVYEQVEFLNSRIRFIRTQPEAQLAPRHSFLETDDEGLVLSACKKAEKEDALILRYFNPYIKKECPIVSLSTGCHAVALDEQTPAAADEKLKPGQFVTLKKPAGQ